VRTNESNYSTVKGARDFYPDEMAVRSWLYGKIREVSESFGYQEFDGPFLERIELYAAKSSDELVKEQAFTFQDRGGDYITLRPELTPSLARMVVQRSANWPILCAGGLLDLSGAMNARSAAGRANFSSGISI
jgi:histidyl-tRNA synthetase